VLVIDDRHELRSPDALALLELLLARLAGHMWVVFNRREDPELGLHRLRGAGRLIELQGTDSRFRAEETRELVEATGIVLSDGGLTLLQDRTEGWAAGLRLRSLSMTSHPDQERFVAEFSGSERTVAARSALLKAILDVLAGAPTPCSAGGAPLQEELSEAELRVVSFVPGNLRSDEIAAELFVSTNTCAPTCATFTQSSTPTTSRKRSPAGASAAWPRPRRERSAWRFSGR